MSDETVARTWKRSSFCSDSACVEVAHDEGFVFLRSSQQPDNVVRFTHREWDAFRAALVNGEF